MNTTTTQTNAKTNGPASAEDSKIVKLAGMVKDLPADQQNSAIGQALTKAVDKAVTAATETAPEKPRAKPASKSGGKANSSNPRTASAPVEVSAEKVDGSLSHEELVIQVGKLSKELAEVHSESFRAVSNSEKALEAIEDLNEKLAETHDIALDARAMARQAASKSSNIGKTPMWVKAVGVAASVATIASGVVYVMSARRKPATITVA